MQGKAMQCIGLLKEMWNITKPSIFLYAAWSKSGLQTNAVLYLSIYTYCKLKHLMLDRQNFLLLQYKEKKLEDANSYGAYHICYGANSTWRNTKNFCRNNAEDQPRISELVQLHFFLIGRSDDKSRIREYKPKHWNSLP